MLRTHRHRIVGALVALLVPICAACGSAAKPAAPAASAPAASAPSSSGQASHQAAAPASKPSTAPAPKLKPVNVAWVAVSIHTLPTWVAATKGFFRQQGLDAHVSYIHGSVTATAAMMSGGLNIIEEAPSTSIEARLKGADTVILATHIPYADLVLVASPHQTGIKSLSDLRGKTVGLTKAGNVTDMLMHLALQKTNLVPGKDVHFLYTGGQTAQLAAFQKGAVQAILVSPPTDLEAEKDGGHPVLDLTSLHLPFPGDGVVSTNAYVKAHPNIVVDYLKAYVEAIRYIKTNKSGTEAILAKYTHQTNPQILAHSYQLVSAILPNDPAPTTAGIQTVLSFLPKGKGQNPAAFIDTKPLQQALQQLGPAGG